MLVIESLQCVNVLTVNIKASIEFYTLFLDFELIKETEEYALITFDSLSLKLIKADSKVVQPNISFAFLSFIMDVDDFTDAIQEIEKEKIHVVSGPDEIDSGESVKIEDPGGNVIELFYQE